MGKSGNASIDHRTRVLYVLTPIAKHVFILATVRDAIIFDRCCCYLHDHTWN